MTWIPREEFLSIRPVFRLGTMTALGFALASCSGGGGSEFAGLDTTVSAERVPCSIQEKTPATDSVKVSSVGATSTSFNVTASTSSCKIFYFINGTKVNTESSSLVAIVSSSLTDGANTIRVEASNDLGSDSYEWTVVKNVVPSCSKVSPSGSLNMINTGTQLFTVGGTAEAGETLSFSWLLDGVASPSLVETIAGASASQGSLTADASMNGVREVSAKVSDGLDSVTCSWTVNVGDDCLISAKLPDVVSMRMAAAGASNSFSVTTSTSSCLVVWSLNGFELAGTTPNRNVVSADLNSGSNLLKAEVTSSSGVTSKTWTLVKNSPPTCSQTPASAGSQGSVGVPFDLTANIVDANSDVVTWNWFLNGQAVSNPTVSVVNGVNLTTATFTAAPANIGYNSFLLSMSDGYDSATCSWSVQMNPNCSISARSPVATTVTVPNLGSTFNAFNITPSDATCIVAWSLNGINLGNSLTMLNVLSSSLLASNTLTATVSNSSSTNSVSWTVNKNSPPVCATQTPSSTGHVFGVGASQAFVANMTDADAGQTMSFNWILDGSLPGGAYFSSANGASSSTGTWTSTAGQVGAHNLVVNVSDTFDTVACSWPVEVLRTCSVTSASPSGTTLRVANLASTNTAFGVVANDPSCTIVWKLNGSTSSTDQNFQNYLSSELLTSNTVDAVLTNSVSTVTRSWSVGKNSPPVCSSQTPGVSGNTVNLGSSIAFNMTATDADTDALTYAWTVDGSASASFSAITGVGYNASATLTPALGQVGLGHAIANTMSDTFDTVACTWNLDIIDPNSAQILSWSPVASPAVNLSDGSTNFSVNASGTGLTYSWVLDGTTQGGMTTASASFSYSDLSIGNHTLVANVTDTYANLVTHSFSIRQNAPPVVSGYSPNVAGLSNYKLGYDKTMNFSVTATDANSDTLTYEWLLDNSANGALVGSGASAVFSPAGNTLLLGPHTVKVNITDGYESRTTTWLVMVNYFSDECNELYNSASTGANGGRVCTLVGNPSMGHGLDIYSDPTLLRARPWLYVEIQPGIFAISDHINHVVIIYNSNAGGSFVGLGQTILPRTAKVVIGNGSMGRNNDASSLTDTFQMVGSPAVSMPVFKLYYPYGLAYDSVKSVLYIADRSNHRVLALFSNGQVLRILGQSGGTANNNSVGNSEAGFGNSASCNAPSGLTISGRYLYVACNGQHVIKRVDINDPADTPNYGLTVTAVGRQNDSTSTKANYVTANTWAIPDGLAGSSSDDATGATALVPAPFSLASDGNGVIYWNERLVSNHGQRIRAYNPTGSTIDLTGVLNSNLTSSTSLILQAMDLSSSGAVTGYDFSKGASQAVNVAAGTLNSFLVGSPAKMLTGGCHAVSVVMRNSGSTPISSATDVTVTMTSSKAAVFYSDAACGSALPSSQFVLSVGSTHRTIFMAPSATGTHTITASGDSKTGTVATVVAAAGTGTPTKIFTYITDKFKYNECVPVELQITNSSNLPLPSGSLRYVGLASNNVGSFFSDSTCSSQIDRVAFGAGDANKIVYYTRQILIPPGWVASIAGYDKTAGTFGEYHMAKLGEIEFPALSGLDILRNGSTGFPDAIGWSTDSHSVSYLNMSSSAASFGGYAFPSLMTRIILANPNNLSSPTSVAAGYNGDDQAAWGSNVYTPQGISFNIAKTAILVADFNNERGRSVELTGSSFVRAVVGAGRERWRQNVGGVNATQVALYNPYKIEFFSDSLYFSEISNNWIRKVNLSTGVVDTLAGNGYAASYTEGNDAVAEGMRSPRGFKIVAYPNSASPTNQVLFYTERTSCIVRAVNLSGPSIGSFYGVGALLPGKVKTVAGDWTSGCATWSTLPNVEGMAAVSARLNAPEDIAYVDGDLYILLASDHCLVKVDTNGLITLPQGPGSCSTPVPTTNDSTMDTMRTRYPRSFYPDVGNPGNYFMVDQYSDTTGFVRYLNALTSAITFKNTAPVTVAARAAGASSPLVVKTIYQYSASSGQSNIGGVTSWSNTVGVQGANDKVCWSAGALSNGSSGAHAIYCANRYQDDDGALAAGPSNASGIRGGAPLDREQEKIGRLNAVFYTPYGLAFDDDGNLYISEYDNHIIRMVRRWW